VPNKKKRTNASKRGEKTGKKGKLNFVTSRGRKKFKGVELEVTVSKYPQLAPTWKEVGRGEAV